MAITKHAMTRYAERIAGRDELIDINIYIAQNEDKIIDDINKMCECAGWKWRDELQPLLKCDYYNPIVKNWSEEDRLREVHERETSDYVLYGITNGIKGVYSIAEVVDDSNKRPEKTIFLNLYKTYERSGESKQMAHSLKAVENMLKANGVVVFSGEKALLEVAKYLNTVEG